MGNRTFLYDAHLAAGGKMVDFGGWDMPIHYGSQLDEHHQVRTDAGVFDVSHMTIIDVDGPQVSEFLRYLLANDVVSGAVGRAVYTAMLNHDGGVLDDLLVYRRVDDYRLVVNCATRQKDLDWMHQVAADFSVTINERPELAMVAIQGPNARRKVTEVLSGQRAAMVDTLKVFQFAEAGGWNIARTGYTGEDGVEIILPSAEVQELWSALVGNEIKPCGLGARDTLRLEAGLNLYGNDMDEDTTPLECNMKWTLALDGDDFIGKSALLQQQAEGHLVQVGLLMTDKGVLRPHQKVITEQGEGEVTSGTFSPTLKSAIALARVPKGTSGKIVVDIRGKQKSVEVVRPPFVRHGKSVYKFV